MTLKLQTSNLKSQTNFKVACLFVILFFISVNILAKGVTEQVLWKEGEGAYKGYRIPAIIVSSVGTILAFAEGRNSGGDSGDIDLILKRSNDNGKTWSNEIVVWNDGSNTCGNPCPVVDRETGRIWLFMTWNSGKDNETDIIFKRASSPRKPYVCYSDDDGLSWSEPVDLSNTCRDKSWGWYATGPGVGIQIESGKYKGRMVIPANHSYDDSKGNIRKGPYSYGSHVLFSDDHGKTWQMSEPIRSGCNESQVTELFDGRLLMNMRSYNGKYSRAISVSNDGGETWSSIEHDYQLVESVCQASIIRYENKGKKFHVFSNPAVTSGRTHMTIRISEDDCTTWKSSRLINAGLSAYSCLVKMNDGSLGLFFEAGEKKQYETMKLIIIPKKKLLFMID